MKTFEYNLIADWSTWLVKEVFVFWLDIHVFLMETSGDDSALCKWIVCNRYPVDTGRKLDVNKTFRRRPGRLLNVLCTSNLRPVSTITSTGPLEINSFSCDIFIKTVSFDSDLHASKWSSSPSISSSLFETLKLLPSPHIFTWVLLYLFWNQHTEASTRRCF